MENSGRTEATGDNTSDDGVGRAIAAVGHKPNAIATPGIHTFCRDMLFLTIAKRIAKQYCQIPDGMPQTVLWLLQSTQTVTCLFVVVSYQTLKIYAIALQLMAENVSSPFIRYWSQSGWPNRISIEL
jgi:hypothetical protein